MRTTRASRYRGCRLHGRLSLDRKTIIAAPRRRLITPRKHALLPVYTSHSVSLLLPPALAAPPTHHPFVTPTPYYCARAVNVYRIPRAHVDKRPAFRQRSLRDFGMRVHPPRSREDFVDYRSIRGGGGDHEEYRDRRPLSRRRSWGRTTRAPRNPAAQEPGSILTAPIKI